MSSFSSKIAPFGSTTPYAEPIWYSRPSFSPWYTESHVRLRSYVRSYVDEHLIPYAHEWEEAGQVPESARRTYFSKGFGVVHPPRKEFMGGVSLPAGIAPEEWDAYHSLIVQDEILRVGYTGVLWGLNGGNGIGCPPIANFGNLEQKNRWLPRVARGETRFCLGITEPGAGSDVAGGISTTATRKGNVYVVNGSKKWITNGVWADYVTAAVRTGSEGSGRKGISLLVIPLRKEDGSKQPYPGVTTRRMHNSGVNASGSTFIEFDDVQVPVGNLIGKENDGFRIIMSNFNPERLSLATAALRLSRLCAADAFEYAIERETFGKTLIENQSIRAKISKFGQLIEPAFAFLEQLVGVLVQEQHAKQAYENRATQGPDEDFAVPGLSREALDEAGKKGDVEAMQDMMQQWVKGGQSPTQQSTSQPPISPSRTSELDSRPENSVSIGGQTALLKIMATRCLEKVCREAQQIMGGAGYNRAGKGARIEQISRDVRVYVVGGGSEEIMRDLAVKQEVGDLMKIKMMRDSKI